MDTNEQRNPISLTLEPELTEAPALVPAQESAIAQTQPSEPVLTAEEQKIVDDFAAKIDVENKMCIRDRATASPAQSQTSLILEPSTMGSRTSTTAVGRLAVLVAQPSSWEMRVLLRKMWARLSSPQSTARLLKTPRPYRVVGLSLIHI